MNYPSIRIEGAILSSDLLDRLDDVPSRRPADFGLDGGVKVKDEIARAWADAQDYWSIFQRKLETLKPDSSATTETRNNWVVPLLGLLGYQLEYTISPAARKELLKRLLQLNHTRAATESQFTFRKQQRQNRPASAASAATLFSSRKALDDGSSGGE